MPSKIRSLIITCLFLLLFIATLNGCVSVSGQYDNLIRTQDDGFVILERPGYTLRNMYKLTSDGRQEWQLKPGSSRKLLEGGVYKDETIHNIIETCNDSYGYLGFGVAAFEDQKHSTLYSWHVPFIFKLNANGGFVWRTDEDFRGNYACLAVTEADRILVGGSRYFYNPFKREGIITCYSNEGKLLWFLDSPDIGIFDKAVSTKESVLFTGFDLDEESYTHAVLVTSKGKILWKKVYKISNDSNYVNKLIGTSDGGFVFVGNIGFDNQMYIARIDSIGTLLWNTSLSFEEKETSTTFSIIYDIVQLPTQDFLVIGAVKEGFGFIAKISATGKVLWNKDIFCKGKQERFQKIQINPDGTYTLHGIIENDNLRNQVHSIQMDQTGEVIASD